MEAASPPTADAHNMSASSLPDDLADGPRGKTFFLLSAGVAALAAFVLLFNLGSSRTLTNHEALVAVPAREMLVTADWVVPRFGGIPHLEKPPLAYWVAGGLGWLFGEVNERTVRLPAAISGLLLAGLVGLWASRWYGSRVGLCGALVQATSVYMIMQARLAEVDMLVCLLTTFALYLVAGDATERHDPPHESHRKTFFRWISIYSLLGLSTLGKQGIGPILVLIPIVAFLLIQQNFRYLRHMANPVGLGVLAGLALIWPYFVGWEFPELWHIWYQQTVSRALGATGDREPIWFYAITVPWLILPWTPLTVAAIPASWNRAWREGDTRERFLWVWFLTQVLLLSLSVGKHKHYVLPALPPLSLLTGQGLARLLVFLKNHRGPALGLRTAAGGMLLCIGVGAVGGLFLSQKWPELTAPLVFATTVCGLGACLVIWLLRIARPAGAGAVAIFVFLLCHATIVGWFLPARDPRRPAVEFAQRVATQVPGDRTLFVYAMGLSPVVFYLNRPVIGEQTLEGVQKRLASEGSIYIVTRRDLVNELEGVGDLRKVEEMAARPESYLKNSPLLVLVEIISELAGELVKCLNVAGRDLSDGIAWGREVSFAFTRELSPRQT